MRARKIRRVRIPGRDRAAQCSFDCARAKSLIERMICEWPGRVDRRWRYGEKLPAVAEGIGQASGRRTLAIAARFQRLMSTRTVKSKIFSIGTGITCGRQRAVSPAIRAREPISWNLSASKPSVSLRIEPMITTQTRIRGRENDISGWITNDAIPTLSGAPKPSPMPFQLKYGASFVRTSRLSGIVMISMDRSRAPFVSDS